MISQALYACGMGFGAFITLSSYNKRKNNLVCDSVLILFSHLLTSAMGLVLVLGLAAFMGTKWTPINRHIGDFLVADCELRNLWQEFPSPRPAALHSGGRGQSGHAGGVVVSVPAHGHPHDDERLREFVQKISDCSTCSC